MQMNPLLIATAVGVLYASAPVGAHVPDVVTPDGFWRAWTVEPVILVSLSLAVAAYTRGVLRVWARAGTGRVVTRANALSFAGGITALVIALVSPLDALGGTLLSAHMAQHGLLAGVAPPLLLLGRPGVACAWGMNPLWNVSPFTRRATRSGIAATRALSAPASATLLHAVMLWSWHAPALFGAAVAHEWVHAVQHSCFFVPALLFWRMLLDADSPGRAAVSIVAAVLTFMHTGLLGALLTMAPEPLYPSYFGRGGDWGRTALEDQQLAGVLMWIPLGLPYLAAGLWLASRVLRLEMRRGSPLGSGFASGGSR